MPDTSARTRQGLPKAYRLLRPPAFTAVLRRGLKSRDRCFAVFAVSNALPHMRIGLVVSRKVSTAAVVRNRVKRQIRESARRHQQWLEGLDLVVVAYAAAADSENAALQASLQRHWTGIIEKCRNSSPQC
ncbi:MAG: ribonuclease P protein component [Gammaproteobacteria bacterium]|nr:ribonuclease P protein component [Gammaproteobacteria bacterium]